MSKEKQQQEKAATSQNGDDSYEYDDGTIADIGDSRYLAQEDVGDGLKLTIKGVIKENVRGKGEEPEIKHVVLFEEIQKGFVLSNKVNKKSIARIAGSIHFRDWQGVVIELYREPTVTMMGKVTGGIRVRPPTSEDDDEESIPAPRPKAPRRTAPRRPVGIHESSAEIDEDEMTAVMKMTRGEA